MFLESLCPTSADGTSLLGLKKTLDSLGFDTECGQIMEKDFKEVFLPCILHWNKNHFVVLYGIKYHKDYILYKIADPAKGKLTLKSAEFKNNFVADPTKNKGIVIFAKPTERFYQKKRAMQKARHSTFLAY